MQLQLPDKIRAVINKYITNFLPAWRNPPSINEIFKFFIKCYR